MQFKSLGEAVHLSGPLQLMWNRISFSRLTIIYFIFSIAHFIIQLSIQIKAFTINAEAAHFLSNIVNEAQTTNNSLPLLNGPILRMCSWVPSNLNVDVASCPVIWNGTASENDNFNNIAIATASSAQPFISSTSSASSVLSYDTKETAVVSSASVTKSTFISTTLPSTPTTIRVLSTQTSTQTVTVIATAKVTSVADESDTRTGIPPLTSSPDDEGADIDNDPFQYHNYRRGVQVIPSREGNTVQITLVGLVNDQNVTLDNDCLWALNWPVSVLGNTKREDMVFMAFQVWVLGMSIVALMNESIPHILASLVTHLMATGWAAFQISHTAEFHSDFNRVITHGACNKVSLLPTYWEARSKAEIPSLALNVIALIISSFLTWRLIKLFGWQTFKRVGASLTINRIYKLVLILSITIQLSLFFMIVTVSLWVDQLLNSVIGDFATSLKLYKVTSFITLALLIPWLMTGWFAVRRELRVPMIIFLSLSVLYLIGWGVMFISTTFRWTFRTWIFFSIMACASVFLTFTSIVLGIICRLNFGKGLARYLNAHQPLDEEDDLNRSYGGSDFEKVAFPSSEKPLPTYASSFDDYESGYVPSLHYGSTQGPRFSNKNAEPFETGFQGISIPAPALQRNMNEVQVHRANSYGSTKSGGSHRSQESSSSSHLNHKRWVIE
ncbi:hypothetical protein JR316_0000706 [Psilocybe cubensis]|uniref:Uncharacterized protein n=1 Tax=Psilocybe cubensis TaxID=181762 RepID=A0ACB8HGN6_PSICU|nr:hypothetical protein JR316_0000706 [Psilocybe cubensis]KAH9486641.1 hypothetical protein JR316_0000706 [Psilocybe cubensis]